VEAGAAREDAYKWVQEHAMAAWETETIPGGLQVEPAPDFRQRVATDPRITKVLDRAALERTFDLNRQLRHVDAIFARVFS
jgi:adenylosuccinate lyase